MASHRKCEVHGQAFWRETLKLAGSSRAQNLLLSAAVNVLQENVKKKKLF
jgi:hypothetical protein